ncbi:2,3-bisphosphoglycerate-independent phosphoglycerate mutase [Tanacetum coccineum]
MVEGTSMDKGSSSEENMRSHGLSHADIRSAFNHYVPVAIGGLGLSTGVRFRKDVPSGGLANVAANVMNLHGFVAPKDYETTLMEVVD